MSEDTVDPVISALEERSRALFQDSVASLDLRTRSRLTQARHAALAAVDVSTRRPWLMRMPVWASGVAAAVVLGVALWVGGPLSQHGQLAASDAQSKFEDLDIIASSDESSGDAMDMLQDDIDFYDWADKAAANGPTA
jgi:hypothetical protein